MKRPHLPQIWGVSFNLTPMIDVIFQLIIFYLCVSQFQKAEVTEAVHLPEAEQARVPPPESASPNRLTLNVLPDGTVMSAGAVIEIGGLPQILRQRQALADPAALEVWIRADRETPYRFLEPILKACATTGTWKVAFKVMPPRKEPTP